MLSLEKQRDTNLDIESPITSLLLPRAMRHALRNDIALDADLLPRKPAAVFA
jgi:hypothetical protein